MKLNKLTILAVALMVTLLSANEAFAQKTAKKEPRTVLDFYKLLSPEQLGLSESDRNAKLTIAVNDAANGYLSIERPERPLNDEAWGGVDIALFKKTSGGYVVVIARHETMTVSTTALDFLEYKAGKWRDVSASVEPQITNQMLKEFYESAMPANAEEFSAANMSLISFTLPRVGRTITAHWDESDETLYKLTWNGAKFEVEKPK